MDRITRLAGEVAPQPSSEVSQQPAQTGNSGWENFLRVGGFP